MFRWFVDEAVLHDWALGLPTWMILVVLVVSIGVLSKGSEWLIDGLVALAQRTGLPKVVIGATIVSLGTTTPEAFVSVMAAFMGNSGLALGNGVGSIIADTGLIFGLTCLLTAVPMQRYILNAPVGCRWVRPRCWWRSPLCYSGNQMAFRLSGAPSGFSF